MVDYKEKEVYGLVSVIIPTYKRSDMLGRAIDSVLKQSYKNVEVLVIDDNSDGDEYRSATSKFMQKYINNPRVRYIQHKKNMNGSAARNTGIINSRGEYIAFLDDDDFCLENRIEDSVNFLVSADISYGGVCVNYIKKHKEYIYKIGNSFGDYNNCYQLLTKQIDYAAGSTLLCKRSAISQIGLFDISFKRHQDWEFLIRFFRYYKLKVLEEVGVVICTDSIRNIPNSDVMYQMKEKLLTLFSQDINKMGNEYRKNIQHVQWIEQACSYVKEKRYITAYKFIKGNICISKLSCIDISNLLYSFIIGLFPSMMKVLYYIYSKKNQDIAKRYLNISNL